MLHKLFIYDHIAWKKSDRLWFYCLTLFKGVDLLASALLKHYQIKQMRPVFTRDFMPALTPGEQLHADGGEPGLSFG